MATTYDAIATVTVGSGGAANIEFTSIVNTYTDLVILASTRSTSGGATDGSVYFNGDTTAANYSRRVLYGDGSAAASASVSNARFLIVNADGTTASTFANSLIYIPNYTSSNNKSVSSEGVEENNATGAIAAMNAGLWNNTAVINAIRLVPTSGNFAQYSTATLYGIKNS